MQVTTLAEARALVGRTFERDGLRRTIQRFMFGFHQGARQEIAVWSTGKPKYTSNWLESSQFDEFSEWLDGATEVTEERT